MSVSANNAVIDDWWLVLGSAVISRCCCFAVATIDAIARSASIDSPKKKTYCDDKSKNESHRQPLSLSVKAQLR